MHAATALRACTVAEYFLKPFSLDFQWTQTTILLPSKAQGLLGLVQILHRLHGWLGNPWWACCSPKGSLCKSPVCISTLRAMAQLHSGHQETKTHPLLPDRSSSQLGPADGSQPQECSYTDLGLCLAQGRGWSICLSAFAVQGSFNLFCTSVSIGENTDKRSFLLSLGVVSQNTWNIGCTFLMKHRVLMAWLNQEEYFSGTLK